MNATISKSLLLIALTFSPSVCEGQQEVKAKASTNGPAPVKKLVDLKFKHQSFTFVRIQYSSDRPGRSSSSWMTDYPDADLNFSAWFQKEIGLQGERDGKVMALTNSALSQFPFIYIAEGGRLQFSDAEVTSLRRYLTGGGFLMVDDFWGENEWNALRAEMKRVFPEREPVELSIDHPVFHCYYDIREKPQVPNVALASHFLAVPAAMGGGTRRAATSSAASSGAMATAAARFRPLCADGLVTARPAPLAIN